MSTAAELRRRVATARLPAGLPPLTVPLWLGVVLTDDEAGGFSIVLGPGWTVATTELAAGLVHDAVIVVPSAVATAVFAGTADPGWITIDGTLTGSMAGQSALSFLVEVVATGARPPAGSGA